MSPESRPSFNWIVLGLGGVLVLLGTAMDWIVVSPTYTGPEMWGSGWEHLHGCGIKGFDWLILTPIAIGIGGYAVTARRWLGSGLLVLGVAIGLVVTVLVMKDSLNPSLPVFFRLNLEGVRQVPGFGYYLTLIGELAVLAIGLGGFVSSLKRIAGVSLGNG